MGHAYFINVGKSKGDGYRGLLMDRVEFAVYVSAGFLKMCIIHSIKDNTLQKALARMPLVVGLTHRDVLRYRLRLVLLSAKPPSEAKDLARRLAGLYHRRGFDLGNNLVMNGYLIKQYQEML